MLKRILTLLVAIGTGLTMLTPEGTAAFQEAHVVAAATHRVETRQTETEFPVIQETEAVVVFAVNVEETLAAETTEATEEVVEETTEAIEEVVEETTEATEEVVEETTEATEEVVEETTEATEEVVEETTEATEEVVEETTEATEEVVEETTEATEEVATTMLGGNRNLTVTEQWERLKHTGTLTARKGYIIDSPCGGSETWYPDAPVEAVKMLEELYGFTNLKMEVREDGVRILSGTMPNGEEFEGLVVVAADVRDVNAKFERNLNGTFDRGEIVETSLGTGIVVDYCLRAVNERKATGHIHIDIATTWN